MKKILSGEELTTRSTRQLVREAYWELIKKGLSPSVRLLKKHGVPETASNSTVDDELNNCRLELARRASDFEKFPEGTPLPVIDATLTVLAVAREEARKELELERKETEAVVRAANALTESMEKAAEDFQTRLRAADTARIEDARAIAEANADLAAATRGAQELAGKIAHLESELKTEREIRHAEQEAHAQALTEIQAQTQARIAQLQEQMRGMEVHMLKQIDEARDRAKEEKARADHVERAAKAEAQIMDARYRRDLEALSKNLDAERKARETMLLDLGRAKGELEITRNEMLDARKKLEGLPDVDVLTQERDGLRERLDAAMLRGVLRGQDIPVDGWIPVSDIEAEEAAEYLVNRGLAEFDDAQERIRMLPGGGEGQTEEG